YDGPSHPHQAQRPEPLPLGQIPRWTGLPEPKPQPERKAAVAEPAKKRVGRRGTAKPVTTKSTAKRKTPQAKTTPARTGGGARKRPASTQKTSTGTAPKTGRSRSPRETEES